MARLSRARMGGAAALVLVAVAAAPIHGATPSSATETRTLSISTSDRLLDEQVVTLSWQGFPAGEGVVIRQCGKATDLATCSTMIQNDLSDAQGSGGATFAVIATNGADRVLRGATKVACDVANPCAVTVVPESTYQQLDTGASAALRFAKTPTGCPQPGELRLTGEGTDAIERAVTAWQPLLCEKPDSVSFDFVSKSDDHARQDFVCGLRDIAITQLVLENPACYGDGSTRGKTQAAPIAASGVTLAYNVRDQYTGKRVLDLRLTPELAALIVTGQINRWNDPRIAALNPKYDLPTKLRVVMRADDNDSTSILTNYLWSKAESAYKAGGPAFEEGPTSTFPSIPSVDLRTGGPAVAQALAYPSENDPKDDPGYGYVGMLDSSAAQFYGLPMAALLSDDGSTFAKPDADGLGLGVRELQLQSGGWMPNLSPTDPRAYPLTTVSHALIPSDRLSASQVESVKRLVAFVSGRGQSAEVLPLGYAALSKEQTDVAQAALKSLPAVKSPGDDPGDDEDKESEKGKGKKKNKADSSKAGSESGGSSGTGSSAGSGFVAGSSGGGLAGGAAEPSGDAEAGSEAEPVSSGSGATSGALAADTVAVTSVFAPDGSQSSGLAPWLLPLLALSAAVSLLLVPGVSRER